MKENTTSPVIDWEQLRPEVTEELLAEMTRRIVEAFHPRKDIDVDLLVIMDSDE